MGHDATSDAPIYYDDADSQRLFVPLLVIPLGRHQSTMILGPQSVAANHDDFIHHLYQSVGHEHLRGTSLRAFYFRARLCLVLFLPIGLVDEAGRAGQTAALGLIAAEGALCSILTLRIFLETMLKTINRTFGVMLPETGTDKLIERLQRPGALQEEGPHLHFVVDAMLAVSTLLGDITNAISPPGQRRWRPRWFRQRSKQVPRLIFYEPGIGTSELVSIFLEALAPWIDEQGQTAVIVEEGVRGRVPDTVLTLMPLPHGLPRISSAVIGHSGKRSFVSLQ